MLRSDHSRGSYSWKVNAFNINGGSTWKFFVRNSNDSQTIREGIGSYSSPNLNHGTVVLRKTNNPGKLKPLDPGDSYDISMLVTWSCGGDAYLQSEYRFAATYPAPPDVQVVSYNVIQTSD